jgi:hypothetical protein
MGLTQACSILRQEFRQLYIKSLPLSLTPEHIGEFLSAFALSDNNRGIGKSIIANTAGPIPDEGSMYFHYSTV